VIATRLMRFAMAGLATFAMATTANAAAILQFNQQNLAQTPVVFTSNGTSTTLTTTGTGAVGTAPASWIPVLVTIGSGGGTQNAFMSFTTPLVTGTAASNNGGNINQDSITGTIEFNFAPASNPVTNILTIQFNGGLLSGQAGGNAVGLTASQPPNSVSYSSVNFPFLFAGLNQHDFTLGFSGLNPTLGITGSSIGSGSASVSGTFSASAVPEPASLVMLSISAVAGLGFYGVRRFRTSSV